MSTISRFFYIFLILRFFILTYLNQSESKNPENIKKLTQIALKVKNIANTWVNLLEGIFLLC